MTPAEIARKAAQIIMTKGWAQGTLVDAKGRVCHNGAIYEACQVDAINDIIGRDSLPSRMVQASAGLLRKKGIEVSPACFNDQDTTTAEDIILHLKELAAWLEDNELPEVEVYPGTPFTAGSWYGFAVGSGNTMQFFSGGGTTGGTTGPVSYTVPETISLPGGYTFTWSVE